MLIAVTVKMMSVFDVMIFDEKFLIQLAHPSIVIRLRMFLEVFLEGFLIWCCLSDFDGIAIAGTNSDTLTVCLWHSVSMPRSPRPYPNKRHGLIFHLQYWFWLIVQRKPLVAWRSRNIVYSLVARSGPLCKGRLFSDAES